MKSWMRRFSVWMVFLLMAFPSASKACEVCFGNPDDPQTKGMEAAILTLLAVTYLTLLGMIAAFVVIRLKARSGRKPTLAVSQANGGQND